MLPKRAGSIQRRWIWDRPGFPYTLACKLILPCPIFITLANFFRYVVPTTLVRRFHFRIQHSQRSKNYVTVIQLSSNSRVLGTGALVKPVKTVYQDEFYRSLYRILGCSARISSEWSGNKRGRIDFRLPEANWGIEILIGFKNIVRDLINDGRLVD